MPDSYIQLGLTALAAIFAVLNPFSIIPIFISINEDSRAGVQRSMAIVIGVFVIISLTIVLLVGEAVLNFFGVSIEAFKIAGGILLFSTGLGMIQGQARFIDRFAAKEGVLSDYKEARQKFHSLIVPIGTPMFVGPGSISTVILYSHQTKLYSQPIAAYGAVFAACAICGVGTMLILLSANPLVKILKQSGIAVLSRLMGLLLCGIAVQFVISALQDLVPALFSNPS